MQPNYNDDVLKIHVLCFASDGKAVFYSGKVDNVFQNWESAEKFSQKHKMQPIHYTEGGLHLSEPNRFKIPEYSVPEW